MNNNRIHTNPREDTAAPPKSPLVNEESCPSPLPPGEELWLQRGIRPWMVNLIAIGGIIGSAYFIGSGCLVSQLGPSVILIYAFRRSDHLDLLGAGSFPVVVLPMVIYWLGRKAGKFKGIRFLTPNERSFDDLFPDKRGFGRY